MLGVEAYEDVQSSYDAGVGYYVEIWRQKEGEWWLSDLVLTRTYSKVSTVTQRFHSD